MRAAIYLRVSTDHEEQKLSPEHQLMTCREHAEQLGFETDESLVYSDAGLSGTEMSNRPAVQRMLLDARRNKFDAVLFTAISRFARDTADALDMRKKLEKAYKIRMISVEEGYDTNIEGKNVEMVFAIYAAMAAHKSQEMSTSIRRGLRQSAASGRHIGNTTPYGYMKTPEKRLIPDPKSAPIIREIFDLYLSGMGSKSIAQELNRRGLPTAKAARGKARTLWQASTINAILHNPVYTGSLVANRWRNDIDVQLSRQFDQRIKRQMERNKDEWIIIENNHQSIIEPETFELVQKTMAMKATNKGVRRTSNVLSGLMRCAECGGAMIVSGRSGRNGQSYKYVGCAAVKRVGKQACKNHTSIKYNDLLDFVLNKLQQLSISPDKVEALVELILQSSVDGGLNERIAEQRKLLEANELQQKKAYRAYTEDIVTLEQFSERQQELKAQAKHIQDELSRLEEQQVSSTEVIGKRDELRETLIVFSNPDKYDVITVRSAIASVIDCIKITQDKRIKINWIWNVNEFMLLNASLKRYVQ